MNKSTQYIRSLRFRAGYCAKCLLPRALYPWALGHWYRRLTGKKLRLDMPRTYNEKLQWLKLYGMTPLHTRLSDKYRVRGWVAEKLGSDWLVPLLGVWDRAEDIPFDTLPERFALKANHGSKYNLIVEDKSRLDRARVIRQAGEWLRYDYAFCNGYEMQYRGIRRRLIAEEYLENSGGELYDYKFWCFHGRVELISMYSNRAAGLCQMFYDRDWQPAPVRGRFPPPPVLSPRPGNLEDMIAASEKLARGFPHVRVDLYRLDSGKLYFGEMTFCSSSGDVRWDPPAWDLKLGELIMLPKEKKMHSWVL
jgi:hypothetical protein